MADIDTGDTVLHGPSGETWTVACVHDDDLHWVGWPPGSARTSDCKLTKKASDDYRDKLLAKLAALSGSDGYDHRWSCARERHALRQPPAEPAPRPGAGGQVT